MRELKRNQTNIWIVNPTGMVEVMDGEFYTGEFQKGYSIPEKKRISMYPADGEVAEKIFGKDTSFDKIATSNSVILTEDSLLFLSEPTGDYATTYDYSVQRILESLNSYSYGLKARK